MKIHSKYAEFLRLCGVGKRLDRASGDDSDAAVPQIDEIPWGGSSMADEYPKGLNNLARRIYP